MAQITITYLDNLQATLSRAQVEHGLAVVEELVHAWLIDRQRLQEDADKAALMAKRQLLSPQKRQQVDDILDGKA